MKKKNMSVEEKKPVLPSEAGTAANGFRREENIARAGKKLGQPLEERQVIRKAEGDPERPASDQSAAAAGELDWALARMSGRKQAGESGVLEKSAEAKQFTRSEERLKSFGRVGQWFQTLCWINIPVFGFIYMLVLAFRKKTLPQKKAFARAYLLYRLLVLAIALTILYVLYKVGLSFVAEILRYAGSAIG